MSKSVREDLRQVQRFASGIRRRMAVTTVLSAVLAGAIGVLAALGLGLGAVLLWGPLVGLRVGTAVLVGVALVGLVLALVVAALRSRLSSLQVARYVESRAPELRDSLLTVVSCGPEGRGERAVSSSLFAVLAQRAAQRVAALDPRTLVPARRLVSLGVVLGLLLLSALAAGLLHGDVLANGLSELIDGPRPVAERPDSGPATVPYLMGDLSVRYVPPEYSGLPDREERNVSGDLRGLRGTTVLLRTRSLQPAREAAVVFDSRAEDPVALELVEPGVFEGELTLDSPDSYHFRVRRPDGGLVVESTPRFIEVRPDEPPNVRLLLPDSDLSVNRDDRVELLFQARDDFGLGEVLVAYERGGGDAVPVRRKLPEAAVDGEGRARSELDLSALDLRPGERVTLWVEATDNDRVSGPKTGRSERRLLTIYSPDEKHAELLRREREMFERLLGLLGDRLLLPQPRDIPVDGAEAHLQATTAVVNRTQAALSDFEALLADMRVDPLTSEDVLGDCAELHSRLAVLLSAEMDVLKDALRREPPARHAKAVQREMAMANQGAVAETERAVLLLDRIIDRQHQERVLDEGRDLVRQTDDLLEMLKRLESGGDEAVRLKMLRELERLQSGLDRMARDIRKQAKDLPDERFNPAALGDRGTMTSLRSFHEELAEIRRLIQEDRLAEARARLEELARGSRDMMATLEGDHDERGSARRDRAARLVRRVRRRVDRVAASQERLQQSTAEQGEAYRERVQDQLAGRLERTMQKQQARLDRLERLLRNVNRDDLHSQDRSTLSKALLHTQDIRCLLDEGDIGQAARLGDRLERAIGELRAEVGQAAMFTSDRKHKRELRKAERRLGHAGEAAEELADGLRSLLPDPEDIMSRREQRRTARLAERQDELRKRLERLRRGLEPLGEEQPGLQGQLDRLLGEAERSMEQAGRELEGLNPGMAEEHQRSVLQKLAAAREQLDRGERPEQGDGDGVGVSDHRQAVEIPQAEEYRVPAAFRQEILKAMREEMPPAYRELLEAYYESLIR